MSLEILAPCGSMESLAAAVRCGANAVYLGTKELNARRNANNFSFDELAQAVEYCHQRNVRVYLTVNTLVGDDEMKTAYQTVYDALKCGVDAFIVQDFGFAKMIKDCFACAKIHASTQCSVMTADGVNALREMGFSRVVVPREMSLDEIKQLRKNTDVELELFVHGALCMCVSGQCYLSAMLGGRSGNRGLCAQPCRLSFSADQSGSCDLSLKDLSLISHIKTIADNGVVSLKIEGRMKRPEYVAAAVTACKKAIDGRYSQEDETVLRSVFSRSGFTDGYFTGKRRDMFGVRQKEDVVSANSVLKELAHLYEKEKPLIPVSFTCICKKDKPISLTAKLGGREVSAEGAVPQTAVNKPMSRESLLSRLSKLGGTQYYLKDADIQLDDGLIVPASEINALRRKTVSLLDETAVQPFEAKDFCAVGAKQKNAKPYFTASFLNVNQIPDGVDFRRIFIPIDSDIEDFQRLGAGVSLPRGLFGVDERLEKRLSELKSAGVTMALCGNLSAYEAAKKCGFQPYADFCMNLFNSNSASMFHAPILSPELTLSQANRINAADTGIVAYGKIPLMLARNCPVKNNIGCEKCRKSGTLTDRKGYKFQVICSDYPCVEILNPLPIYLGDRMAEIQTDFVHFCFTDEKKDEVLQIVNLYKSHKKYSKNYTRGLYYRGVK